MSDLARERRGPKVFAMLGWSEDDDLSHARRDEMADRIRQHLESPGSPLRRRSPA
jgi:hypothetical protein